MLERLSRTIVVTGHYGSGKTNLSLNIALKLKELGREVTLADVDVVNPYFRSADFRELSNIAGIRLITPGYAGSSLDIPSLGGELDAAIGTPDTLIVDAGGDGDGAYALGRYSPKIAGREYDMLFVVNFYRYLTSSPADAAVLMADIEAISRLKVTGIVNNSNLGDKTVPEDIYASMAKALELSGLTGRPLVFTSAAKEFVPQGEKNILPVGVYVKTPWN